MDLRRKNEYRTETRFGWAELAWTIGLILFAWAVTLTGRAQQTVAPFKTSQANSNLYVNMGAGTPYSTIAKTVTAACALGANNATVVLLQGANPSDTISGQTGVCTGLILLDYTVTPPIGYKANSSGVFVAQGSGGGGPPTGAAGGDLSGNYPNPLVSGLKNVPFCTGFTPTNGQAIEYTTGGSPSPCYAAVTPSTSTATSNIYVGFGTPLYTSIQSAVTAGCAMANGANVILLPGSNPTDSIPALTSGCTSVSVLDQTDPSSAASYSYFSAPDATNPGYSKNYATSQSIAPAVWSSVTLLGDSITAAYLCPSGLIQMDFGLINSQVSCYATSSDQAVDVAFHQTFGMVNPGDTGNSMMIGMWGTNDSRNTTHSTYQPVFKFVDQAIKIHLGTSSSSKITGTSFSTLPTHWSLDTTFAGTNPVTTAPYVTPLTGFMTSTPGACVTTPTLITSGAPIFILPRIWDGNTGVFSYQLDGAGTVYTGYNETNAPNPIGQNMGPTQNGASMAVGAYYLMNVPAGSHTVTICMTSSTGTVAITEIATSQPIPGPLGPQGPMLVNSGVPYFEGDFNGSNTALYNTDVYNDDIDLSRMGVGVHFNNIRQTQSPIPANYDTANSPHPSGPGLLKINQSIMSTVNPIPNPQASVSLGRFTPCLYVGGPYPPPSGLYSNFCLDNGATLTLPAEPSNQFYFISNTNATMSSTVYAANGPFAGSGYAIPPNQGITVRSVASGGGGLWYPVGTLSPLASNNTWTGTQSFGNSVTFTGPLATFSNSTGVTFNVAPSFNANGQFLATGTGTGSANFGSYALNFLGSYGSGGSPDLWSVKSTLGTGATPTSSLVVAHPSGTSGNTFIELDAVNTQIDGSLTMGSVQVLNWNSDTGISRDSAGVFDFGTGAYGNTSGTIKASAGYFGANLYVGGTGAGNLACTAGGTNCPVFSGNGALSAATSDAITVTGTNAALNCVFSPTNGTAAAAVVGMYVASITTNIVNIAHAATTASGGTVSVICR